MYLIFVLILGLVATIFAIPLAIGMSKVLVEINSFLLNFTVSSMRIPFSIILIQMCAGIALPCIVSIIPIWQVTKRPARENLSSTGLSYEKAGKQNGLYLMRPSMQLGFKNTFRRRGRFLFITATLACACLMLMTALNLRKSTAYTFERAVQAKNYDVQFILGNAVGIINDLYDKGNKIYLCSYVKKCRYHFIKSVVDSFGIMYDEILCRAKREKYSDYVRHLLVL